MLTAMDDAVGKIVDAVDAAGARNNTLFVFSSDNGGPRPGAVTDNGKFRAGKGTLYEGGVRVAAFATWDGNIRAGSRISEPMHIVDWYPTLVKLCGANEDQTLPLDGLDIWPTITQGKPSPHDAILLNTAPNSGAIRKGEWKLVIKSGEDSENGTVQKLPNESIELFHLTVDPYETSNLAAAHPEKTKELRTALDGFAREAIPPKLRPKASDFVAPAVWGE
jgi:arylsulfatase A-like enzyme